MLEEFKDGSKWGVENGFKSGFFGAVEILFHKMFPGTTIRDNPNIESKFHPKASGMNGRVFPIFPSWQLLFGKDRATSEMAEDAAEIREDASDDTTHQSSHEESFVGTNDCYISRYTDGRFVFGVADFMDLSVGGSQNASPSTPTSNANATTPPTNVNASTATHPLKKARKLTRAEAKQDSLTKAFGSYMSETKEVMEKLVNAVAYEHRLSERRQGVFTELEKLNLEIEDMLTANAVILVIEEKVNEFYSVPKRYRQQWVGMLLQGKLKQK
ncbi:Outer membrane protein like [Actinidia chinensis var. chinensis]|uniref:Outer membrane protein like n=1 Tax=Actinidia chinensis var. chinensis TaxID=1590841 RepID=A0A2R6PGM6_ACTCC|nr:Outer membrane protein like [Actinidia chinensis var. chinensis]